MKWAALAVMLFVGVPLMALAFRRSLLARKIGVALLAYDLFNPAHINLISEETYRGDSRGIEICSVDLIALSLAISIKLRGLQAPGTHRLRVPRLLYLGAVLLSLTASADIQKSGYAIWKLLRMFFAFGVLTTSFVELEVLGGALLGLAIGVTSQGLLALQQKYVFHMVRVVGSQSHPNSLAMIVNMISPIALALVLSGEARKIAWVVFVFAAMCDIFSLSRGGMMMYLLATMLVVGVSMYKQPTSRKVKIVAGMVVGAMAALAKSAETIIKRFTEAPKESVEARRLFNEAAKMMANANPFGVGINMFSHTLSTGPYADQLGIDEVDRGGLAHHIYWLTAAETGYFGAAMYVVMLAAVYVSAVQAARLPGVQGDIGLGLVAGLTVTYLQGTAEWIARQTNMSYCFWLFAAIACSILENRGRHENEVRP